MMDIGRKSGIFLTINNGMQVGGTLKTFFLDIFEMGLSGDWMELGGPTDNIIYMMR